MDIAALQPLPPFSWQQENMRDIDKEYCRYYGIDYSAEFAGELQHRFGVLPLAGFSIAVHYFQLTTNTRTAVIVHGYYDHVGLYGHLVRMLLGMGCNVLAYDLPGHGLSSGERAGIGSFDQYRQVLDGLMLEMRPHLPQPLYLIGQSTGGSIAMDYVLNNPHHGFEKVVLLAPLVIPRQWLYLKLVVRTLGLFLSGLPREFVRNSHDDAFLNFLEHNDPLQPRQVRRSWGRALMQWQRHFDASPVSAVPVLLIQGDKDTTVDWRYNLARIKTRFTQLQVVMLEGGMHHLVNESQPYRERIWQAIRAFLG